MSEFKGTKGPWKVVENGGRMVGVMSKGEWVTYKAGQDHMTIEELEANASLISAAPQLLEALQLMVSTYPYSPPCHGWESQVDAHVAAKQAIAKALGK